MVQYASDTLRSFEVNGINLGKIYSLPALQTAGLSKIDRLPRCLRIILESLLRHADETYVDELHIRAIADWEPRARRSQEIPFIVSRLIAPDASGLPLLGDLAAMRDAVYEMGENPRAIEPVIPVDLIVDHSLTVEHAGKKDAVRLNLLHEYNQNKERYSFLKWAANAFDGIRIVPPGIGIIHQINMERLATGVHEKAGIYYPDTVVGPDSHTAMVNGIGILGWGVGGIEAEAAMLGQPIYLLTPDVVGVQLTNALRTGVTATDLVLTITQALRRAKVVGKFVEFFGQGVAQLAAPDRATIANMAPEYGATAAYFPVDENTLQYFKITGRSDHQVAIIQAYFEAQEMFGTPQAGEIDYTEQISIDLSLIEPCVAGPSRPQDRVDLDQLKSDFIERLSRPTQEGGFAKSSLTTNEHSRNPTGLQDGDIVLAAITSCSNTSNPGVLLAAGLLARKAVQKGLKASPHVKTSFTPGSRVVTEYLVRSGLQQYLDKLGFQVAGYGCATCMGNSGPLPSDIETAIEQDKLVVAAVLSGNRNFEARIHQSIRANYLMSPPLVIAFALFGRIDYSPAHDPLGADEQGLPIYLHDIWPTQQEIAQLMPYANSPEQFQRLYADFTQGDALWKSLPTAVETRYPWDDSSTYLRRPPYFDDFHLDPAPISPLRGARALVLLGNSVTTDHVSPASAIRLNTPAGRYLDKHGIGEDKFSSYVARRTNHDVMIRGTFANVRLRNLMVPDVEGGVTTYQPDGTQMSVYDAAMAYKSQAVPLIVIAGEEYGTGSSRDWAAKGPALLGVRAVIARGFERIHRSNLVGMGILPCQFTGADSISTLGLDGTESYEIGGIERGVDPNQELTLNIHRSNGEKTEICVLARIDTLIESVYFRHGGILPYILRQLLKKN